MRLSQALCMLVAASPLAFADVKFSSPAASASLAGGSLSITWADSGDAPALADLSTYSIILMTGANTAPVCVAIHRKPPQRRS